MTSFADGASDNDELSCASFAAASASAESSDASLRNFLANDVPVMEDGWSWVFRDSLFFLSWNRELLNERFPRL